MSEVKECPEATAVYLSGDELRAAWQLREDRQYGSLSWAVRILVRAGMKALGEEEK